MNDETLQGKQPGQETLLRRLKRGLVEGYPPDQTAQKSAGAPTPVKGWSDSLATISTGVVAIATLAGWLFGGAHGFPHWFTYIITVFVLVAIGAPPLRPASNASQVDATSLPTGVTSPIPVIATRRRFFAAFIARSPRVVRWPPSCHRDARRA